MKSWIIIVFDFIADFWILLAMIGIVISNKAFALTFIILSYCMKMICNCLRVSSLSENENDKKNGTDN